MGARPRDSVRAFAPAWWVAIIIAAVTFALLAGALRSWVLPLKAIVLNVLSLSAAYGITVLIWQHGVLTHLLFGQQSTGAVTVWVPVGVFAFLFGLSMDYEVFLLSRIKENTMPATAPTTPPCTVSPGPGGSSPPPP